MREAPSGAMGPSPTSSRTFLTKYDLAMANAARRAARDEREPDDGDLLVELCADAAGLGGQVLAQLGIPYACSPKRSTATGRVSSRRPRGRPSPPSRSVPAATINPVEPSVSIPSRVETFEARMRAREEHLAPYATRSYPARRARLEPDSPVRTPFQRDRDRIVHTKAFRRLKHKTQVFVAPEGDHYRTRLTHTLEVTQVSRTVARALDLNEDLVEAIGVGHDLGHPPFGHLGEAVLDDCLRQRFGGAFRHHEHSLRVVDVLERDGTGLNLNEAVRDGILCHSGRAPRPATPEGRIVRLVDRIAYINHDIDDALRAGVISPDDLPSEEIALLGPTSSRRIDVLVRDLVERSQGAGDIVQGEDVGGAMASLRSFMFERVYMGPEARQEHRRIEAVLRALFEHYCERPELLPAGVPGDLGQRVTDYLAGMTDRFCIREFEALTVPRSLA